MAEPQVVTALIAKRAELGGHIVELEKRIARLRDALASVDTTIRLFSPGIDPAAIPAKRPYRRHMRHFSHRELPRLVADTLRRATGPLTTGDIVSAIMQLKGKSAGDAGFNTMVSERVACQLRALSKRGEAVAVGTGRAIAWALCSSRLVPLPIAAEID